MFIYGMTYFTSPELSSWQKNIVLGTILGGSSIVKPSKGRNCYLFMRSRHRDWLAYKSQELKLFSSQRPFTEEGNTLRWHSNCYPVFNEFRDLFYVKGAKIVNMEILDRLRDIGWAVWYGDCGKIKNGKVMLNTHKFGKTGTDIIVRYFNEVDISCESTTERKNYRVLMTEEGSERFLMTMAHCMPDFMHSRLVT